jgi:hypothetical protein
MTWAGADSAAVQTVIATHAAMLCCAMVLYALLQLWAQVVCYCVRPQVREADPVPQR